MKYKCKICGFIHEGEMPDGYCCPLCGSNFSFFTLISEEEKKYNRKNVDLNNPSINRINEKCINCGVCKKTCENIVNIKCSEDCINCGQCILTCPTGALTPKYDYNIVLEYLNNKEYTVVALTSPAVRVGIGDAFSLGGEFLEGKMVSALKELGFDYVFDTTFGADLTSIEEACELKQKLKDKKVMFSSCCPSWVSYANLYHPEILDNISKCKSPIGMISSVIKNYYLKEEEINPDKVILVAITPCTAKKSEIVSGDCDYVLTTSELALLIREQNINFSSLKDIEFDRLTGSHSGTIYGASSGVALSVLRVLYHDITGKDLTDDEVAIKECQFYKEIKVKIGSVLVKCAIVSTNVNVEKIIGIKDNFNFIEVMNCEGGCIYGGGQIITSQSLKEKNITDRTNSLFQNNKKLKPCYPYENPIIKDLYEDFLKCPGSSVALEYLHK